MWVIYRLYFVSEAAKGLVRIDSLQQLNFNVVLSEACRFVWFFQKASAKWLGTWKRISSCLCFKFSESPACVTVLIKRRKERFQTAISNSSVGGFPINIWSQKLSFSLMSGKQRSRISHKWSHNLGSCLALEMTVASIIIQYFITLCG